MEVVDSVIEVYGASRVGVKLSPNGNYNDIADSDPIGLFSHVVEALNHKKIGHIEVAEYFSFDATNAELSEKFFAPLEKKNLRAYLKPLYQGAYMANSGYDLAKANAAITAGETDLVSFGTHYLTNADLIEKFTSGKVLNSVANVKDPSKIWTHYFYGTDS